MAKRNPFKGPLVVSLVALGLIALSYFVLVPQKEASEKEKDRGNLLFGDLQRENIIELKIDNAGSPLFIKEKAEPRGEWILSDGQKSFDGDKTAIDGIISSLLAAKSESTVSNQDLVSLGLAPAKFKVALTTNAPGKSQPAELWVGEDTPVDYLSFAKWADKPEVFLTSRSLRFSLDKKLSDLRNRKILKLPLAEIQSLRIRPHSETGVRLEPLKLSKDAQSQWIGGLENNKKQVPLDSTEVQKWVDTLNTVSAVSFPSDNPAEKSKFGFGTSVASLVVETKNDKGTQTQTWLLGRVADRSNPEKKNVFKFYLTQEGEASTFEVAETFKDNFKVDLFKFRPKKIVDFEKALVSAFSIQDGKNSIEFTREGENWKVSGGAANLNKATGKPAVISGLLDTLVGLKAKSFQDEVATWTSGMRSPTRVIEVRGKKGGEEVVTLATLVVGAKVKDKDFYIRTQEMESTATAEIDIDGKFLMDTSLYAEIEEKISSTTAPGSGSTEPGKPEAPVKGEKKKVKLEPTVGTVKEIKKLPASIVKPKHKYTAEMEISNGTKLEITFAAEKAPYTVSNFLHLARNGYYNGVKFHRVIPNFVAQGGDPTGTGAGGPGYEFDNENNDLKHVRGALSMAHRGANTNGSQFFVVLAPQSHLDGIHPVFGSVTKGLELIDGIKQGDAMKKVEVFEEAL